MAFEHLNTWQPRGGTFRQKMDVGGREVCICESASWRFENQGGPHKIARIGYDAVGRFYAEEWLEDDAGKLLSRSARIVRPDQALRFILSRTFTDGDPFAAEVLRELDTLAMPCPTPPAKRPKGTKKKAAGSPFAVQLEMATALVEVVHQLAADAQPQTLAEARREVTKLHQSLHTDAALKLATA
jgi:hypothetical protein